MSELGDMQLNKTQLLHSRSTESSGGDRNVNRSLEHNFLIEATGELGKQAALTKEMGRIPEESTFKPCVFF